MTETVVIPVRIPADDLWSAVFGSAFETWSWYYSVDYIEGDWDVPGKVMIMAWDGVHEDYDHLNEYVIDLDDLVEAYTKYVNLGYKTMYDDLDAVYGDVVVQLAMYGEVIYG